MSDSRKRLLPWLWVVEMWSLNRQRFEPTVGVALTQREALKILKQWKTNNPHDRFGLAPYARRGKPHER